MMSSSNFHCLVIDDEPLARELIVSHLNQFQQFKLVASCASAMEASQIINERSIDLVFLDIEMPLMKGTDFYKSLRTPPKLILTTAYREYAIEGFELEAIDYLLKPITFTRFFKAIERFLSTCQTQTPDLPTSSVDTKALYIQHNRKRVRLLQQNIVYIQGQKDYIQIHTTTKHYLIKQSIASFQNELSDDFIRVHRSYIINQNFITAYTRHDVELGEIEIPIGASYRTQLIQQLGDLV